MHRRWSRFVAEPMILRAFVLEMPCAFAAKAGHFQAVSHPGLKDN